MSTHTGKTKNENIRRRAELVGWFVMFNESIQVARSGRVEEVVAQRSEFVLYS